MKTDARGLVLTTDSAVAAREIDQAVADYLDYRLTASGHVKAALDADPNFVLAHCVRGYFFLMLETKAVLPRVAKNLDEIRPFLAAATERERLHVAALEAWAAGDIMGACGNWERILREHPLDLLALKLHHTMAFYTGRSGVLRATAASVLGAWDDTMPGYGCVEGMYAYALEECGDYAEAERWGRRATERNPGDLWAVHSVAHVLEMQGRAEEGAKWLSQPPGTWADKNPFKAHVWWHGALFALARGDIDRALSVYDNELLSVNTEQNVDVSNQAALLKRLELQGIDVGDRWEALADHAEQRMDDHMLPFRDAHYCLALAAAGRFDAARRHIDLMRAFADEARGWRAESTRNVLVPLCEGIVAHAAGEHDKALESIWPVRNEFISIGGSHAQRDLFAQILCDAAVHGSRPGIAQTLLSERVLSRPGRKANWLAYAGVLDRLGDTRKADAARRQAAAAPEFGA